MNGIRFLIVTIFLFGVGCGTSPSGFEYKEMKTRDFNLASWQKITKPDSVYKIYVEGDSFNVSKDVIGDIKPKKTLVSELAFGDPSSNVVYLGRPCQYLKSPNCSLRHEMAARFAPEIIISIHDVIRQIASNQPVILIGYSDSAQIVGLVAAAKTGLNVKKVITIAGNLDHLALTEYHQLPPLNESMNLESYHKQYLALPQINYIGKNDKVIPPLLSKIFLKNENLIFMVPEATHDHGWENIYPLIWNEE